MRTHPIARTQVATSTSHYLSKESPLPAGVPDRTSVNHVLHARRSALPQPAKVLLGSQVQRVGVDATSVGSVVSLAEDIYYGPRAPVLGPRVAALGLERLGALLARRPEGLIYYKDRQAVAVLLLLSGYAHPVLQTSTAHVAFWGYVRGRVNADEAAGIKADWLLELRAAQEAHLSMQVAEFNEPGLRLARGFGFQTVALRVEKHDVA